MPNGTDNSATSQQNSVQSIPNTTELQKLYSGISQHFDIGSFDEFSAKMKTPEDRQKFYNTVSQHGADLGDYQSFENRLGGEKKNPVGNGSQNTQSTSTNASAGGVQSTTPSQPSSGSTLGNKLLQGLFNIQDNQQQDYDPGMRSPRHQQDDIIRKQQPDAVVPVSTQHPTGIDYSKVKDAKTVKSDFTNKAILNTALKKMEVQGSPYDPKSPSSQQDLKDLQEFYNSQIKNGGASLFTDANGQPALRKVSQDNFLDATSKAWNKSNKEADDANKFVNNMTTKERVDYYNNKQKEENEPEYAGTDNTGNWQSLLGSLVGGNAKFIGKKAIGSAIGAGAQALAPETFGASELALPAAASFLATAKESTDKGGMSEVLRRYPLLKQQHPDWTDEQAMSEAEKGLTPGMLKGAGTDAVFSVVGDPVAESPISQSGKDVLENGLKGTLKSGLDMGSKSAAITVLGDEVAKAQGVNQSTGSIINDAITDFKDNATVGAVLHGVMTLAGTAAPAAIKGAFKYAAVNSDTPIEDIQKTFDNAEDAGKIPKGLGRQVVSDLEAYKKALGKVPDNVPEDRKATIAQLIQDKDKIQQEATIKDKVFQETTYKPQLEAIDEQIKTELNKPNEISSPKTEQNEEAKNAETKEVSKAEENNGTATNAEEAVPSIKPPTLPESLGGNIKLTDEQGNEVDTKGEKKEPNKIGVSHNSLTELAKKIGLKEPERGTRLTDEQQADRGRQLLNAGADVEKLESDFKEGKQPTADDVSVARAHLEDLHKIADAMKEKWGKDSKQYDDANKEIERFSNEVMKPMGSKTSEPFSALRGERDIDTGSFTAVKKAVEDNKGSKVTKSEENKIDELTSEHSDNRNKAKEAEAKLIVETDKDINDRQSGKEKGTKKKSAADYAKERKDIVQKMRADLIKGLRGDKLMVGVPYAAQFGIIAPHIANLVKSFVEQGVDNFNDIVSQIHDELKGHIEGLRKRDVMDLIAGDYNKKNDKTKSPDEEKYANIKQQAVLTKKLQDLQNDLPEDFDKNKKEQTPEVKQLLEQIAKVRKDLDEYKGVPEKRRIAALEKRLEDLRNGTEKEPTPEREKSEKEKQLLEQIEQEKLNQGLKRLQTMFADKKDNKFTPDEAKALWDYAHKQYLDKGTPFNEMIKKVALDTGLTFKQVSEAITSPKIKPISDEMWAKQAAVRRSNIKVKDYIDSKNDNAFVRGLKTLSKIPKGLATALHGHIFAGTHYPMGFVTPSQWGIYFNGIGKAWRNAYGKEGFHEKEVQDLTSRPLYEKFKRAGLQNDVDNTNIDEFEKGGKILGAVGRTGARGFLGMKWTRQMMAENYWDNLPKEQQTDESAKVVASLVNLATGASNNKIPAALQEGMFAAGMESARWGRVFQSPAKAISKSMGILHDIYAGNPVKPEDKVFLKVWGSRVGQQLGTMIAVLGANAYVQSKINPKNPVNLTDWTKPDWLKLKFDNTDVDLSGGTLGVKNYLVTVGTYAINDKNHKQELGDIGGKSIQYVRGKLSPLYGDAADVALGTDYSGNPLPFSNKTPSAGTHKLSWPEYLTSKAPIFIAEGVNNLYAQAEQNGIPKSHTDKIVNGIMQSVITTGTGVRTSPSYQKPTPFTDDDYKDPVFKYFSKDWGMDLPNTAASSETIKDDNNGTKMKLSEYPKDIQDKYTEAHKQNLHEALSDIKDEGVVYVKTYKDGSGNKISLNEPSDGEYDTKDLDKLSEDEKKQVLRLAQDKATAKTKQDIFNPQ